MVLVDVRRPTNTPPARLPGAVHMSRSLLGSKFSGAPALQTRDIRWCCTARPARAALCALARCTT